MTLALSLFADHTLQQNYSFRDHTIMSTTLFPDLEHSFELFTIPAHMNRYRISSETIIEAFAKHGVAVDDGQVRYVNFMQLSPINVSPLCEALRAYYSEHYPSISYRSINVVPRVYTEALPKHYSITIADGSYRYDSGTFYITDDTTDTKLFFDYSIDADVRVMTAREDLSRDTVISPITAQNSMVSLNGLNAEPLYDAPAGKYRLRRHVKSGEVILQRYVELAPLVLRRAGVLVMLKSGNILIQFHAIALQDGGLHDIISIQKPDGQRLKARVIGENRVEIE